MNNPNFHGFGMGDSNLAEVKLGKRRMEQYKGAQLKTIKGAQLQPPVDVNLPLKTGLNYHWSDEAR